MIPSELPPGKWQDLAIELLRPTDNAKFLLVAVDYYTRFYEVEITTSTTKKMIIFLEKIFARYGKTDNGPQFMSQDFKAFVEENGIRYNRMTPLWAQANGEVERQNRSILNALKIAQAEGKNWRRKLVKYLFTYRTTPHSATGIPPTEMLFQRSFLEWELPEVWEIAVNEKEVRERDWKWKPENKSYADVKHHVKPNRIIVGDEVLLKQKKENKLTTEFEHVPYQVIERNGSSVTIQSPGKVQYR